MKDIMLSSDIIGLGLALESRAHRQAKGAENWAQGVAGFSRPGSTFSPTTGSFEAFPALFGLKG